MLEGHLDWGLLRKQSEIDLRINRLKIELSQTLLTLGKNIRILQSKQHLLTDADKEKIREMIEQFQLLVPLMEKMEEEIERNRLATQSLPGQAITQAIDTIKNTGLPN